jgi:hypothetical protein
MADIQSQIQQELRKWRRRSHKVFLQLITTLFLKNYFCNFIQKKNRKNNFLLNFETVNQHNVHTNVSFLLAVQQFSDMSLDEFLASHTGHIPRDIPEFRSAVFLKNSIEDNESKAEREVLEENGASPSYYRVGI